MSHQVADQIDQVPQRSPHAVKFSDLYTDAILTQLRSEGYLVLPEDEAQLSPFGHEHINMLGRYSFAVPDAVTRGELRSLRAATVT